MKRRNLLAGFVVALGCSQMIGYLTGAKTVSACGAGTCFAPMAEVFSALETATPGERFEPFAAEFSVRGTDGAGAEFERRVTPESLARIEGPHARRANYANAFVARVSGEVDEAEAAWCLGFGADGPLRDALELPGGAHTLVMQVATGAGVSANAHADARGKTWTLALDCTR
ncbi:MAG: hypothetical protein H7067_02785 [Burkholderiales bacterium]|nr:hypothetical protein [Opitutaceae bacterium]